MNVSILIAAVAIGLMIFARLFMGVLALLAGQTALAALVIPVAVALLILYGFVVALARVRKDGKLLLAVGLLLNGVPPLIMAGFMFWLFFSFKM